MWQETFLLKKEKKNLEDSLKTLNQDNQRLSSRLTSAASQNKLLEAAYFKLKHEHEHLTQEHASLLSAASQNEQLQAAYSKLKHEHENLTQEHASLLSADSEQDMLRNDIKCLNSRLAEASAEYVSVKTAHAELGSKHNTLRRHHECREVYFKGVASKYEVLKEEQHNLQRTINTLAKQNQRLQDTASKCEVLKEEQNDLQSTIKTLEKENQRLQDTVELQQENLATTAALAVSEQDRLQKEIKHLKLRLAEVPAEHACIEAALVELESKHRTLKRHCDRRDRLFKTVIRNYETLHKEHKQLQTTWRALVKEQQHLQDTVRKQRERELQQDSVPTTPAPRVCNEHSLRFDAMQPPNHFLQESGNSPLIVDKMVDAKMDMQSFCQLEEEVGKLRNYISALEKELSLIKTIARKYPIIPCELPSTVTFCVGNAVCRMRRLEDQQQQLKVKHKQMQLQPPPLTLDVTKDQIYEALPSEVVHYIDYHDMWGLVNQYSIEMLMNPDHNYLTTASRLIPFEDGFPYLAGDQQQLQDQVPKLHRVCFPADVSSDSAGATVYKIYDEEDEHEEDRHYWGYDDWSLL